MKFDKSILREADIRGVYGSQVTPEFAYRLGTVFGTLAKKKGEFYCVVGHDNRFGGPELTDKLIEGLLSTGIDVIDIGLVTTPMFNFACHYLELEYGIMVTASHNPKEDNGFKLFGERYQHCSSTVLETIYHDLEDKKFKPKTGRGTIQTIDISTLYAKSIVNSLDLGKKKMRVVVDCGNGTASVIIRKVYEALPFDTIYLFCDSDPSFPNHHPDPNVKENLVKLSKAVRACHADLGIAYDGDCDRAGFVDNEGEVVEADVMMAILARDVLKNVKNKTVLVDVKCSKVVEDEVKKLSGKIYEATASSAKEETIMLDNKIPFGGGYSNHFFFMDRHLGYDDGIYVGLRVQEYLTKEKKSLHEIVSGLNKYYNTGEIKIGTKDEIKFKIVDEVKKYCDKKKYSYTMIDGLKIRKENAWALVRASNTGPNLTLRFEGTTAHELKKIQEEFMSLLKKLEK